MPQIPTFHEKFQVFDIRGKIESTAVGGIAMISQIQCKNLQPLTEQFTGF